MAFKRAMRIGIDLSNEELLNKVFDNVLFRVKYIKEEDNLIKERIYYALMKLDDEEEIKNEILKEKISNVIKKMLLEIF